MVSYLPLPGGWFALANRALNPSLVCCIAEKINDRDLHLDGYIGSRKVKLLVSLTLRYLVGFPAKLVAATSTMTFWIPADQINPAVWISLYAAIPIAFNMFNVRRYGEIEFWLATIKVTAFVGIIISGILLPLGASSVTRLLGTDTNHVLIPCDDPASDNCVSPPGFICMAFLNHNTNSQIGSKAHSKNS
jgi:amino acid transporter